MDDEGIMPLVLEDGKIEVSISNTQLTAKGTLLNDRLYEFIEKRNALELQIEELDRKEARMVLDGANLEDVHKELAKEGETLVEEMNNYVKQFIIDNNENVLGPSVFMMMCSTLPYPVMTPQIEDIMRTAPLTFKQNQLIKEFLSKAKENMQLIEEHQRVRQNVSTCLLYTSTYILFHPFIEQGAEEVSPLFRADGEVRQFRSLFLIGQ